MLAAEAVMADSRLLPEERRELARIDAEIGNLRRQRTRLFVELAERREARRSWTPRLINGK